MEENTQIRNKDLEEMELHDILEVRCGITVLRAVNGWVYMIDKSSTGIATCFVPEKNKIVRKI